MDMKQLADLMRNAGVVGAGGAGFPAYAKLNMAADTIILNCAECEPLLKLHRQVLARYAREIMLTLEEIAEALGAGNVIIAVKPAYREAVEAVRAHLGECPKTKIGFLPEIYPAGDEVVTIYETTGRVLAPGALPITVGCIVYNVETLYNVYRAKTENAPVTHKYITIAGAIKKPCTLKAPLGITYGELIEMAGGESEEGTVIIAGGPMTGLVARKEDVVTKTSNAILVLPKESPVVQKRVTPFSLQIKQAMAACCQCRMCTDLCSRNLLGQPIEPHKIMRAAASGVASDPKALLGVFSCSSCGICEMYACGQGLNPRTIISEIKGELLKNGITAPLGLSSAGVDSTRAARTVPMSRLTGRLGLAKYDVDAPIQDAPVLTRQIKLMLSQSIGAPASACVAVGDRVKAGDAVGMFTPEKLGTGVHTPFDGTVTKVTDRFVVIKTNA
jgi:Na+-translocating ferredoxin:NAD+ oxidoreductase RnfC subunit